MPIEFSIPWASYYELGSFVYDLAAQIFGLPDPLDLFLGLFSGRPTLDATAQIGTLYNNYSSPTLKLLGLGAGASLQAGVPLSQSSGDPIFGPYFKAALTIEQGIRWGTATAQNQVVETATLAAVLHEAGNLGVYGLITIEGVQAAYESLIQGNPQGGLDPTAFFKSVISQSSQVEWILLAQGWMSRWLGDQKPPPITPPTPTPPPPPKPPPPPISPNIPWFNWYNVCQEVPDCAAISEEYIMMSQQLANIARMALYSADTTYAGLSEGLGGVATAIGTQSANQVSQAAAAEQCCAAVIEHLHTIAVHIRNLTRKLPRHTALEDVISKLDCICTALQQLATPISDLGNTISSSAATQHTDLTAVVQQLINIVTQGDVDDTIFAALQQAGLLSPADLQTLHGLKWSDTLAYITNSAPWKTIAKAFKIVGADVDTIGNDIAAASTPVTSWVITQIEKSFKGERNLVQGVLTPILTAIKSALKPSGAVSIGSIGVNPDTVLADAATVALDGRVLAILLSLVREGAGEQLGTLLEYAGALLGFEELREVQLGPLVQYGVARVAEQQAKAMYRQEVPGAGIVTEMQARGIIGPALADSLLAINGTPSQLAPYLQLNAQVGLSPFILIRLMDTGLFTTADLADELTFAGVRPATQTRILHAAAYMATDPERKQARAAYEEGYVAGFYSDAEVQNALAALETNTDRTSLIMLRMGVLRYLKDARELEASYTTLYESNLINTTTYQAYLAGLQLQQSAISARLARDEARAAATLSRKEAAAAATLARETAHVERRTAVKNYVEGNLSLAALTAGLIATGLTPIQAAATADLATIQKQGSPQNVFGLSVSAAQGKLLRQRVNDLTRQREILQITDAQYTTALTQLGLSPTWINALRAGADAHISPKSSAVLYPVQTN